MVAWMFDDVVEESVFMDKKMPPYIHDVAPSHHNNDLCHHDLNLAMTLEGYPLSPCLRQPRLGCYDV